MTRAETITKCGAEPLTAEGHRLISPGAEGEYADWLGELGSVETVVGLDVHEFTDEELTSYGPIRDSPGTSPEEDYT
jgi:hypothetical protein